MNNYFNRLFLFNNWANQIVVNNLSDQKNHDSHCIKLMSHIFYAQSNWYKRITLQQNDLPVWESVALTALVPQLESNGKIWLEFIRTLNENDFNNMVDYSNLAGQPFRNTVQDLLCHVVNHSTYHRGQIVRRIRELGYTPPSTDFINFARIFPD